MSMFSTIDHWFSSPKAQAIAQAIEEAAIRAAPIVAEISSLVPNRTFQSIAAAYQQFGVPLSMTESQLFDPAQQGLALRDLATAVIRKDHVGDTMNILNAAVELAVAANSARQI